MKKMVTVVLLALVVLAAITLLRKRQTDLTKAPSAPVLPVVVDAALLSPQDVRLTLPAMGLVSSDRSTTLSTRISGQVLKVTKQEGDAVHQGDILARIEAADLTAKAAGLLAKQQGITFQIAAAEENVKAATTALDSARTSHARTLELLQVKGASIEESSREESEIAALLAKLTAAKNAVASLRKEQESLIQSGKEIEAQAQYATITAPIDGTISQALVRPGDLATPGKPLFRIAAGSGLSVNLSLPDTIRAKEITLSGLTLPLATKNEAAATGLAQYLAPLPTELGLTEGQYVNLRVVVYQGENVLVPMDALLSTGSESFVFVYEEESAQSPPQGKAVKTKVEVVARGSEGVVVAQALSGKTILLAKPDLLLRAAAGVPLKLLHGGGQKSRTTEDKGAGQSPLDEVKDNG